MLQNIKPKLTNTHVNGGGQTQGDVRCHIRKLLLDKLVAAT